MNGMSFEGPFRIRILMMLELRFRRTALEGMTGEIILNWISDNHWDLMPIPNSVRPERSTAVPNLSCPKCRGRFSILRSGVNAVRIEARLRFWARSAKEEQSRNDLWQYVQMVQVPRTETKPEHMRPFTLQAQVSAMRFALCRGKRDLCPLQTYFRNAIFNLGCYGLRDGEYDANSYENRKVPMWCCSVGRIECGFEPLLGSMMHEMLVYPFGANECYREYAMEFYRELRTLVSGSWRRNLFKYLGGNGDERRW